MAIVYPVGTTPSVVEPYVSDQLLQGILPSAGTWKVRVRYQVTRIPGPIAAHSAQDLPAFSLLTHGGQVIPGPAWNAADVGAWASFDFTFTMAAPDSDKPAAWIGQLRTTYGSTEDYETFDPTSLSEWPIRIAKVQAAKTA